MENITLPRLDVARAASRLYYDALRARRDTRFPSVAYEYAERAIPLIRALIDSVNPPRDDVEADMRGTWIEMLGELSWAMPADEEEAAS